MTDADFLKAFSRVLNLRKQALAACVQVSVGCRLGLILCADGDMQHVARANPKQ